MSDRRKAMKVGMFTFVTGLLVAIVLVTFGGLKFWKHRDRYYVNFTTSVMGLSEGTQVFFNGIKVGKVAEIKLDREDPGVVRVALDLDRDTPVRTDTVAMLNMAGITGLKSIDLEGGTAKAAPLPPGSQITVGHGILDKLQAQAEKLVDQTDDMMKHATQIMDGANTIITNVAAVTDPKQLGAVLESTRITAQNLQKASAEIGAMVAENRAAMKGTVDSIAKATDNANGFTTDMRNLIHNNQGTISATLADIRQAARTFKDLAREVREKPSRLMFSDAAPERKLP